MKHIHIHKEQCHVGALAEVRGDVHDANSYRIGALEKIICVNDCTECDLKFVCWTSRTPAFTAQEIVDAGINTLNKAKGQEVLEVLHELKIKDD